MTDKKIHSMLQQALEDEISPSEVDLWPAVKATLAGKQHQLQEGVTMETVIKRHIPRTAAALLLVVVLLAVFLATPQGRSFAQSLLRFFNPADGTSFPLDESQIALPEPALDEPTAVPPAPLISVAEAEVQLGFEIAELPNVPNGFEYLGVRRYGRTASIEYNAVDGGGYLIIQQSQEGFYQSEWERVPPEAVVPVKIGELDGEFAQGLFVVYPGATSATWNPDAPMMRLRWQANGIWFEIAKQGDVERIEYLDRDGLIGLAESLSPQP